MKIFGRIIGVMIVLLLFIPTGGSAANTRNITNICGTISDSHWSLSDSPYLVTCNIQVSGELIIDPGVVVKFQPGTNMNVTGTLLAQGVQGNLIVFTSSNATPSPGDWGSISLQSNSTKLSYSLIEYGTGISINNSSPSIEYSTIIYNASSGIYLYNSSSTVSHNKIMHNNAESGGGVNIAYGSVTLDSNDISWNHANTRGGGIHANGWGGSSNITIINNSITHNSLGDYGGAGILFDSANGLISGNLIDSNVGQTVYGGGVNISGASGPNVILKNNIVTNNISDNSGGVTTDSFTTITGNYIANNKARLSFGGLSYSFPSVWHDPSTIPISCNTIINNSGPDGQGNGVFTTVLSPFLNNTVYGNSGFQYENGAGNDLDATNNYWGTNDLGLIASSIYDHSQDPSRGTVSFEPHLIAPDSCAPPIQSVIVFIPGIMGSRLHNNPKTDTTCESHFKGELWLKDGLGFLKFLQYGNELTLKPDSPTPTSDCDQIYPEGIFDSGDYKVYSNFISSMRNDGYTVHSFSYDWRLSLEDSANQLDTFINRLNVPKVVLVGHSMGGLVAHTYIANSTRAAKVDKVISVGSPYWGSPKLALSMRSGLPPVEIKIPYMNRVIALPIVANIIRNSPGAMVLLPSEAYLATIDGNYYYKNGDQALNTFDAIRNFFVSNSGKRGKQNAGLIDQSRAYHTAMDDFASGLNSADYYILAANHLQTRSVIREYPCTFLLLPDTCYEIIGYAAGDDTVPYKSASLPGKSGSAKIIPLSSGMVTNGHGGLMQDIQVINKIKAILSGNPYQTTTASTPVATPAPLIQVSVWGDANVSIKDNANQFLGLDAAGYVVNEIPGATADFNENWTEIVLPSGQAYTVKFEQKSTIPLKLKITDLRAPSADADFTPNQRAVFVDIPSQPGGVATLPLDLSAGLDSLRLSNDTNNDGTPEQIQPPTSVLNAQQTQDTTMPATAIDIQGVLNSAGVYRGPVTITLSATDTGLGVHETKYSLDGGKTWQVYSTPLTFDASTTSMFYACSVDLAGNSEYPFKTQLLGYRTFLPATIR